MMPSASDTNDYSALFNEFGLSLLLMSYTVLSASVIQIEKASIILSATSVNLLKTSTKLAWASVKLSVALKKSVKSFIWLVKPSAQLSVFTSKIRKSYSTAAMLKHSASTSWVLICELYKSILIFHLTYLWCLKQLIYSEDVTEVYVSTDLHKKYQYCSKQSKSYNLILFLILALYWYNNTNNIRSSKALRLLQRNY